MSENIKLQYPVQIYPDRTSGTVYFAKGCEFFMDEHGKQWVKFVATNGYAIGKEHMVRTELATVIRDDVQHV
jgi:hypothetical protein